MTRGFEWHPAYERALLNLRHWLTATRVDAAVLHFVATGEGDVTRDASGRGLTLIVGWFAVLLTEEPSGAIKAWHVRRRYPL